LTHYKQSGAAKIPRLPARVIIFFVNLAVSRKSGTVIPLFPQPRAAVVAAVAEGLNTGLSAVINPPDTRFQGYY
jgi:hypothetical protein